MATLDEDIKKSMRAGIAPAEAARGNVTPADIRAQASEGPVQEIIPQQAWKSFQGIGGESVYKNTNVDESKYGQAIYSDSALGATPGQFDTDIANNGIGATGLDSEGNSTGTFTPFSSPIQSPEMQQKAGGIEMAGVNPVGSGSPFGQNQYGNVGQGTNGINVINQGSSGGAWWNKPRNQRGGDVSSLMKRMPYGTAGDRAKRRSMIAQAGIMQRENENVMRNKAEANRLAFDYANMGSKNALDQQRSGIDAYNAESSRMSAEATIANANKPADVEVPRYKKMSGGFDDEGNEIGEVLYNDITGMTRTEEKKNAVNKKYSPSPEQASDAEAVLNGKMSQADFEKKWNK